MAQAFDRDALLDAFDEIGRAAVAAGTKLQIAVYGGSASCEGMIISENRQSTFRDHSLMLASNFRFATEDVDIADIGGAWPHWLKEVVADIARKRGWSDDWFNDSVQFHLSPLATRDRDHLLFRNFPRLTESIGLSVFIPSARYMLAMKLKSLRVSDFKKGALDMADAKSLLGACGINDVEAAVAVLAEFFPRSAVDADKQRFVLRRLLSEESANNASEYPR